MLSQTFINEMKEKLEASKKQLTEELSNLKPHEELGSDLDSNAQEVEDDEVSQDLIARMQKDLEKIDAALAKISDGSYGTDDEGNAISEERLRVIPWAEKAI